MSKTIYCSGSTAAAKFAASFLAEAGLRQVEQPDAADYILLDVPSTTEGKWLRDGRDLATVLSSFPKTAVIVGGNLHTPLLQSFRTADLLQDAGYLAENAWITAEAALDVALPYLDITVRNCPTLILGWGRIGKCLGKLLGSLGADVTIAARKGSDLAMIQALGYQVSPIGDWQALGKYRLIFNTVPALILSEEQIAKCHAHCVKIDLASSRGMEDKDVIIARGLPGLHFPESTGRLIAQTLLRKEKLL